MSTMEILTLSAHGDSVRDADSVVLPCEHAVLLNVGFDFFAQIEH
jgi:hypothetical protein